MPKPVLQQCKALAAGISANLAFACDLRIAADNARFIEAFSRIGLVPDAVVAIFYLALSVSVVPWRWLCSLMR